MQREHVDVAQSVRRRIAHAFRPPATLEDRNIRNLYLDTAWQGVWTAGIGTFLAVFMARMGANAFQISALTSLPALITILISLPASVWVERQLDHVRVTTTFRILFRLTYLVLVLLPFFFSDSLPQLIVLLWCIQAVPAAIVGLSWTSVVAAVVPPRRRPSVNGGRWAMVSSVTAVCVALFGWVLDWPALPFPLNYQVVFFISAVTMFISVYYFARIKMPAYDQRPQSEPATLRERTSALLGPMVQNPGFIRYLSSTFLVRLGMGMPVALYSIFWVDTLGASDTLIGLRTTLAQGALVAGYYLFGRLASRRGHRGVLIASAAGIGLYPVLTALSPTPIWLLPAAVVWGFFAGGVDISFFEGLLVVTPAEKRPSFAALNAVVANVAVFAGPFLGSAIAAWIGIRGAFFIAGALHLAGAVMVLRLGIAGPAQAEPAPETEPAAPALQPVIPRSAEESPGPGIPEPAIPPRASE